MVLTSTSPNLLAFLLLGSRLTSSWGATPELGEFLPGRFLTRLDSEVFNAADRDDRFLLLVFSSSKSKNAGVRWYEERVSEFLDLESFRVFCIVTPPASVKVVSKAVATRRLQQGIDKVNARIRDRLDEAYRKKLDHLQVDWFMDWNGEDSGFYHADPDQLTILLRDPEGRLVRRFIGVDGATVTQIFRTVSQQSAAQAGDGTDRINLMVDRLRRKREQVE